MLDFFLYGVSDDLLDVRTSSGVEVAAELSGGEVDGEKKRENKQQEIRFVPLVGLVFPAIAMASLFLHIQKNKIF